MFGVWGISFGTEIILSSEFFHLFVSFLKRKRKYIQLAKSIKIKIDHKNGPVQEFKLSEAARHLYTKVFPTIVVNGVKSS